MRRVRSRAARAGAAALVAALASCVPGPVQRPGPAPPALVGAAPRDGPQRTITAEDLLGLRDVDAFLVSPDGARVAYLLRRADAERDAYDTGWFVADVVGGTPPVYLGDGGEPQLATRPDGHRGGEVAAPLAAWSPDGRWLAYLVQERGETQLWRSCADGGRRERLTRLPSDVRDFRWASDGGSILVAAQRETRSQAAAARAAEARQGYRLDDRFFPGRSGEPYYRAAPADAAAWTIALHSGRMRLASEAEFAALAASDVSPDGYVRAPTDAVDVQVSADGRAAAWLREEPDAVPRGGRRLETARADGSVAPCAQEPCAGALDLLGWSSDGETHYFVRRFGVARRLAGLYAYAPADGGVREILATDALLDDCVLAREEAVCAHETATTPRRLVAIDLESGALRAIVDPNPELAAVRFGPVETIDLTNAYGHESFAQILTPPDYVAGRAYPVVVVTYRSRGFLRGGVGDEYPPHLFAAAGFVVLSFDMPDSFLYPLPESETDAWPGCAGCAAAVLRHTSAAASLELGLAALERRGLMDPDRVAVTGLSAGASIVYAALIGSQRRFAAAITSYAPGDPITAYVGRSSWREGYLREIGGLPDAGGRAYFEAVSPARNAAAIEAPLLMHVADSELVMSMQTIATLEHMGKPLEVYVFPDELHVKRSPAHRAAIYRRNLQWLEFWLLDREPDAPLDPGQVQRWRALRAQEAAAR